MKQTFLAAIAIAMASLFNQPYATNSIQADEPARPGITTLVIDAHVTVVLVDDSRASVHIEGKRMLSERVSLKQQSDTLVISGPRYKNLKQAGTIFIPVGKLKNIRINSNAHISSFRALQIPLLTVEVNGDCEFSIANMGEVKITGTENVDVEQTRQVRTLPKEIFLKKF